MTELRTPSENSERRLRVHALFRMPDLVGEVPGLGGTTVVTGVAHTRASEAVELLEIHFDSEDLRLVRWGASLVYRSGTDAVDGWTLTLPQLEGSAAEAVRRPLSADGKVEVPTEIADLVVPLVRRNPLLPVATLATRRVIHTLSGSDGDIAEVIDDVVSIMDGEVVAGRFRELEMRSLGENPTALDPIQAVLEAHGALPGAPAKAISALGPVSRGAADVPPPGAVGPDDSAGAAVHAHLVTHVRRFLLQDVRVRNDLPDSVHQMRVAARRLRSGLRVFAPLVQEEWARHLRDELGWAASELGLNRDSEVLLNRLQLHADALDPDDAARIHAQVDPLMQRKVDSGRHEALAALRSERHLDLLDVLVEAATDPQLTEAAEASARRTLPELFFKAWRKLAREIEALSIDGPAWQWHETRITAKRARYAAEALTPVFGAPVKALASALGAVTEQLGEHQDASIAKDTCREMAAHFDGQTGFALGLLFAYEGEQEMVARHALVKAWPTVRRLAKNTSLR